MIYSVSLLIGCSRYRHSYVYVESCQNTMFIMVLVELTKPNHLARVHSPMQPTYKDKLNATV
jgi:hypothetical protein